jgi:hypothetical protein
MAQALSNAQQQVNLATLPSFSNKVKEDQYTPTQWLQKCYCTDRLHDGTMNKSSHTSEML